MFNPKCNSTLKAPRFTTVPEAPTTANLRKVRSARMRIHHALSTNSTMSCRPSLLVPSLRSMKWDRHFLDDGAERHGLVE